MTFHLPLLLRRTNQYIIELNFVIYIKGSLSFIDLRHFHSFILSTKNEFSSIMHFKHFMTKKNVR